MAAILNRIRFSEIFGFDPGADIDVDLESYVVDCGPLTISAFTQLKEKVAEAQKTDIGRLNGYKMFAPFFGDEGKPYFFPDVSWTSEDVIEWFTLIDFTFDADLSQLSGQLLLNSDATKLFTEADWDRLLRKYSEYYRKLPYAESRVKNFRTYSSMLSPTGDALIAAAEKTSYQSLPYSGEDFMAVVKELVDDPDTPSVPPGHSKIKKENISYYARYTTMLQSSCTGKTRFLMEGVKEDADSRCLIIYLTMNSNLKSTPALTYKFCNTLENWLLHKPLVEMSALLDYTYEAFIKVLFDGEYLKMEYKQCGSVLADKILDMMEPLPNVVPPNFKPTMKDITLKVKLDSGEEKKVYIVFAIDEAHGLLKRSRKDAPDLQVEKKTKPQHAKERLVETGGQQPLEAPAQTEAMEDAPAQTEAMEEFHADTALEAHSGKKEEPSYEKYVSLFIMLRRMLLTCQLRIPFLLVSTNSRLSNFMPHHLFDPSRRDTMESSDVSNYPHLHRPMLLQETFDVWARKLTVKENYSDYINSVAYIQNLFKHGRPYWGALQSIASSTTQDYPKLQTSILNMAGKKLLAVDNLIPEEADALGLLGQTVYVEPVASSEFASKLVECRMGFLKMVDNLQHHFIACVYPEPVLSIVATNALFTNAIKKFTLPHVLNTYNRMTELGHADVGSDGEFVVRLGFYVARMLAKPAVSCEGVIYKEVQVAFPRKLCDVLDLLAPINTPSAIEGTISNEFNTTDNELLKNLKDIFIKESPLRFTTASEILSASIEKEFDKATQDVVNSEGNLSPIHDIVDEELLQSKVNFTHWIKLESFERMASEEELRKQRGRKEKETKIVKCEFENILEQALVRSSALIMPDNNKGVDLAIPMVTKSGNLGVLFIQVKNYVDVASIDRADVFKRMAKFAEDVGMQGRCLHILASIFPEKEDAKAAISPLDEKTLQDLILPPKPSKKGNEEAYLEDKKEREAMLASLTPKERRVLEKLHNKVIPSLILAGINYDFGEGRPAEKGPVLDNKSIENIRKILGDLSGMYRGSRRRFVPNYAHYFQRNQKIFPTPPPTVFVSGFADDEAGLSDPDEAGSSAHLNKNKKARW